MDGCGYTKRTRLPVAIPNHLMTQLQQRMAEIGLHREAFLHMGELTRLFTQCAYVMVAKAGNHCHCLYPPEKEFTSVIDELGDW